jgi:hypothetical protein
MTLNYTLCNPCLKLQHIVKSERGVITQCLKEIVPLVNGVQSYFVEVTSDSGVQYGISAYGNEAKELYEMTMTILGTNTDFLIPQI